MDADDLQFVSISNLIDLYESWNKPELAKKWRSQLPHTKAKIE